MKRFLIFAVCGVLLSCTAKDEELFKLRSPKETGIDFTNTVKESDEYNILKIYYLYNGGGVSVGDFDNNGYTDVFFTGNMVENQLYLNQGDFKFKKVTETAGVGALGKWSYGSSAVDINGDGWLDLYVCSSISADPKERTNMLFINQGLNEDGIPTFVDMAAEYGLDVNNHSTHASFFDYDLDGDLDVFVLSNSKVEGIPSVYKKKVNDGTSPITDQLFRNNGDGTFTDVSTEVGITSEGYGLGLATIDINKDGAVDIYVGNDFITNDLLYMNDGGRFNEQIDSAMKHQSRFSMGSDAADINNDGHVDVVTLDMLPETNLRKKTVIIPNGYIAYINDYRYGYTHQYVRNMLQVNNGNNTFSELGQLAGIHQTEWSWSPLLADFDNDGFKDLAITNGYPKDITDLDFSDFRMETTGYIDTKELLEQIPSVKVANYLFKNNGDLTFTDVSGDWGFTQPSFSNGAAYADLDNDGDLDYIVNNINDPAFVYENTLNNGKDEISNHYLRLKLNGTEQNPSAFGARATLYYGDDQMQYQEMSVYRGYISTVEDIMHFGLGASTSVDQLIIEWPNGKMTQLENVDADQVLELSINEAVDPDPAASPESTNTLFSLVNSQHGITYKHQEADYIDYNIQPSIPHKFSQFGPSVSVGDLNNDGLDDYVVGGSVGHDASVYLQQDDGTFSQISGGENKEKLQEDMGMLLFDADGDGDNDLYIVSGGFESPEGSEAMRDRLYLNDGKGNLTIAPDALPDNRISASCVRGADFDGDGDIDLFVGGRVIIKKYPFAPESVILQNQGDGTFINATDEVSQGLKNVGMVTDALWSDYDNDNDPDLIVSGEFMPITIFANEDGKLAPAATTGLDKSGIWNSLYAADFDNDGDMDYIAGNTGINNFYCATPETPLQMIAKDFDSNGDVDAIMSCYLKAEDGKLKPFPVQSWQQLYRQTPIFRKRFDSYKEYGQTTTDQLLTAEEKQGALEVSTDYLHSSYIENLGNGNFEIRELPLQAQVAPVNGINSGDFNDDGNLDILLVGNDYGNEVNMGQYDALMGLVLIGDGQGNFKPMSLMDSGFKVEGDAKGLARLVTAGGNDVYLATQNRGKLLAYSADANSRNYLEIAPDDFKVIFTYADGQVRTVEIPYGAGFMSQSTRKVSVPEEVSKVEIVNFRGGSREVETMNL